MSQPIIEVQNLSKRYRLGAIGATSLREECARYWDRLRGKPHPDPQEYWALRDISFEVGSGEVVGVIGRNGAGKSTLLKILSRITEPTSGHARLRGRVASLLEVGTGFHPELTGRENVYLNGAILGMNRAEVRRKFDEIVAFAEIEKFIDTPVKRYSSGMYVRLAFAVAAHLEPEILIVDEVLAVGDAAFQKKCLGKLRDLTKAAERTVLFVSHDMAAISALTDRCVLLHEGTTAHIGATASAITRYFELRAPAASEYVAAPNLRPQAPYIQSVRLRTSEAGGVQAGGRPLEVRLEIVHPEPINGACLSIQIVNQFQHPATHLWIYDSDVPFARQPGRTVLTCRIPATRLNVGHHTLRVFLSEPAGGRMFETLDSVCPFEMVRLGATTLWGWRPEACVYHEDCTWLVTPN